jgi:RNA polymerase-binding transcription factor DksA
MAVTKKSKHDSARSPKKTVKKAPVKAAAKPMPKKVPVKKSQPPKSAPRKPAKAVPKKTGPVAKPKILKKPAAQASPAKKAAASAAVPKKDLVRKIVSNVSLPSTKAALKPAAKAVAAPEPKKQRCHKGDLQQFRVELLAMRDRITGQSGSMRSAALQRNDETNHEEDGTDAFLRLQTLEQVSSQQQIIANIDEALRSIEKGTYGVCFMCGELINKPRLAVLPFAKNCIKCQSEMERPNRFVGRGR